MPPRKAAAAPVEGTRRSTRIADKPAPPAEPEKKAAAPKKTTKKRAAPADDKEDEAPAAKKAKPASKPAAKPKSTAKKPASKSAAAKPKPASKASKARANGDAKISDTIMEGDESKAAAVEEANEAEPKEAIDTEGVKLLVEGDVLPDITLKNEAGEDVQVSTLAGADKGLVIFAVPKANTPGCTKQACLYRDSYPDFESLGYSVYCLSADTPAAQGKWKTAQSLPYPLLSDKDYTLIKALGAFVAPKKTKRSHFVFSKGSGKLSLINVDAKPDSSTKQVLEHIKSLKE